MDTILRLEPKQTKTTLAENAEDCCGSARAGGRDRNSASAPVPLLCLARPTGWQPETVGLGRRGVSSDRVVEHDVLPGQFQQHGVVEELADADIFTQALPKE